MIGIFRMGQKGNEGIEKVKNNKKLYLCGVKA